MYQYKNMNLYVYILLSKDNHKYRKSKLGVYGFNY